MPVPLYTRGLAQAGCDEPFHELDRVLGNDGVQDCHETGTRAAKLLFWMGRQGHDGGPYPIPHKCSAVITKHLQDCGPSGCDHEKQCNQAIRQWISLEQQERRPYAGRLSDGMAQRLIDFHLADIDAIRYRISEQLRSHGDAVLRRWRKMSKDKRGRLLSAMSPRVFGTWPAKSVRCTNGGCYEEHLYTWAHGAWLNIRDFAEDWMKLISILRVRTAHDSASWALYDLRMGMDAIYDDEVPMWFSDRCVALCGDQFGRLTDDDSKALHASIIVSLPKALMLFQAQHELLCMPEDVLNGLLKGIEPSGSDQWSSLVTQDLHSAGCDISWNSYVDQPFTAPVGYSVEYLYRKTVERLDMVNDELMLLQTDPAYTQQIIKQRKVALSNGSVGSTHEKHYQSVGKYLILELLIRFEMWQTISSRCKDLVQATSRSPERCSPGSVLPPEVAMHKNGLAVSAEFWLETSSRIFEQLIRFTNLGSHNGEEELLDAEKATDRLKGRIRFIREDASKNERDWRGYARTFGNVERDESAGNIMDQPTREYINDVMILDEIITRVHWAQQMQDSVMEPSWVQSGESCCIFADPKCRPSRLTFEPGWEQRIGALARSFMDAPWPKGRKDLTWLAKANLTRQRLAQLWQGIFIEYRKAEKAEGVVSVCSTHFMKTVTHFADDPTHRAYLEEERAVCEAESRKHAVIAEQKAKTLADYSVQTHWGVESNEQLQLPKKEKTKIKSTWSLHEMASELPSAHLEHISVSSPSRNRNYTPMAGVDGIITARVSIAVKNESLVVFQKMYRAGTEFSQGSSIRWQAFVHAMKDAGFAAAESAGSAVSFRNSIGGSICFHRPHPDPVLSPIMLYAMAKRLTKWFDFTTETFVLKGAEAVA